MGKPIGFFNALRLGDRFITVDRSIDRVGAGVVPIFDGAAAELPSDSQNARRQFTARFDKMESGSGPVGQFALHAWLDDLDSALVALDSALGTLAWIGDEARASEVTVGHAAGVNVTITVTSLVPLDLDNGDLVFFSGGAWGVVNLLGGAPPHTLRVATLSGVVAGGETCYRAWRIYQGCRWLGFEPGDQPEESMDGFRMDMKLRFDSKIAPLRSTAW